MLNSLTPEQWERIKVVFHQVVELEPEERASFLDSSCGGDAALREQVELLMAHHESATEFLEPPLARGVESLGGALTSFSAGDFLNNRFRILRFIGKGGMGEVYEAKDELGGVHVALKTIRCGLEVDAQLNAQFRREVQIARQITHSNVCRIHDIFECEAEESLVSGRRRVIFLSMEFLEGESLAEYLGRHGKMSVDEALPVVRDIVAALGAAHEQGVIHRDLKSSNVMLVPTRAGGRRAVLTDFGLADIRGGSYSGTGIAGTPDYMAPEQIVGGSAGFAADIFSLGVVMYEMVTGHRPFAGSSTISGAGRRASTTARPPGDLVPDLDPRWDRVIMRCLEPEPTKRYGYAPELLKDLETRARVTRRSLAAAGILLAAGLAGWLGKEPWKATPAPVRSVAVLPFQVLTGDADTPYFAEGLTDELIQMLARVPGVRVTARNSSSQIKGGSDVRAAGKRLGVQTVLTGGIRKRDGRVTVTAQLVDVADGQWLWSGNFDEEIKLLPRVRVNLGLAIVGAIQARFPQAQLAGMGGGQTENSEAYRLYLIGRHFASYRTEEGLKRSIDYLEQSIANDAKFAPAHAELAEDYNILAGQPGCPPEEYFPKAEAEAIKALALDRNSGEAHISLGLSYQRYRWDWAAAEREFREGVRLSNGLALAHHRLAGFLSNMGQHAAALHEIEVAEGLDPLSAPTQTAHGVLLYRARQYDAAIRKYQEIIRNFPNFVVVLPELAEVYRAKWMWVQSLATYHKADELSGYEHFRAAGEASILAKTGRLEEAQELVRGLEAGFGTKHYSASAIAYGYRGLGDLDQAFYWFGIAADRREPTLMEVKVDPANDPLRGDRRFGELLERLRL